MKKNIDKILIPQYPFRKYKIPKRGSKTRDHILTVEEIIKLKKHKPLNDREKYARDIFMLMFYLIGIESKDLYYLGKPRNGRIYYDRFKTGKEFSIRLEPEALEIIKRYKGKKMLLNASEKYKDHRIFFRTINHNISGNKPRNVHGILPRLDIQKNVTTKWARHTWATIARNDCKISMDDISFSLGHTNKNNLITDMYIKHDYSIIDESNRKVIDFVNLNCASLDVPLDPGKDMLLLIMIIRSFTGCILRLLDRSE